MKETDINFVETTNPVIDTGRLTISHLAAAGIKEATDVANMLGLKKFMKQYKIKDEMVFAMAMIQEARYSFLNRYIENSRIANVMDFGCGFSPRGLVMAREGRNYLGCDLETATNSMNQVANHYVNKVKGKFSYHLTDITNPNSILEASYFLNGEIGMCCEGLLMYLGLFEFESMLSGISAALHRNGGYFITPDLATAKFMSTILNALLGQEKGNETLLNIARTIEEKSDIKFTASLSKMSDEQLQALLQKYNLRYEYVPFMTDDVMLNTFKKLNKDQLSVIKNGLKNIKCLKLTTSKSVTGNFEDVTEKFSCRVSISGPCLSINLEGRLDSITAPILLNQYQTASKGENITNIFIDVSKLEYISSAGLRTLLIMQKALPGNKVMLRGVSEDVLEILRQTGFTDILQIC